MSDLLPDATAPIRITATVRGNNVTIEFPKEKALVEAMRSLPVKQYDWRTRRWSVPLRYAADAHRVLSEAGADASELARSAGLHALREVDASEISGRYPGLFSHQREGIRFLAGSRGAILADDMGLGKTRQAIIALHERRPEGNLLVVCPASLKLNWEREIRQVLPDAEVAILNGPDPVVPARWTVVNYDILSRKKGDLKKHRWAGVILDEAHYIKNQGAARSEAALSLLSSVEDRYLLTGTPVMNRPIELFSLLRAVEHPLGDDYVTFGKRYCAGEKTTYGWDFSGASNLEELRARTEGTILRRRKEDVLDLPPKLRNVVPVPVDYAKHAALHDQLLALAQRAADSSTGHTRWNELLPVFSKLRHALGKDKVKHTAKLAHDAIENGEKVIIFTCFNAVADALQREFGEAAVRLTGDTPQAERQAAVDRFQQDPGAKVFVGNILAAGTGITLTAATQVLFNDLDWVPANHLQAEDRAYRIGQAATVNVQYVSAPGTVDEAVWAVLERKFGILAQLDYAQDESAIAVSAAEDILREFLARGRATDTGDAADRWLRGA